MTRFTLTIDLDTQETFEDLIGAIDSVVDKLKLAAPGCPPRDVSRAGSTIRDHQGRIVGSWEIREGNT
jgi:hypothetical protein